MKTLDIFTRSAQQAARIAELEAQAAAAQERFAEMWRVATEAAFSNQDDRCCFCNTRRGRLHEENCSLNAWQHNAAALAAAQQPASDGGEGAA